MEIIYKYEDWESDEEFPIYVSRRFRDRSEMLMNFLHFHDALEISMITHGKAYYEFQDKKILLETGDCIIINNIEPHRSLSAGVDWEQICIMFIPGFIWRGANELDYAYIADFFGKGRDFENHVKKDPEYSEIQSLMADIHKEFERRESGYRMMVKAKLLCLLTYLYRRNRKHGGNIRPLKLNMRKLYPAIKYIEKNYAQDINLMDAARLCFFSPQYFSKIFKQTLGMTFIEYVTRLRIDQSKKLLENTDLSILNIASKCGYNNLSNFVNMFKKETGFSPLQYRKHITAETAPTKSKEETPSL